MDWAIGSDSKESHALPLQSSNAFRPLGNLDVDAVFVSGEEGLGVEHGRVHGVGAGRHLVRPHDDGERSLHLHHGEAHPCRGEERGHL